MPHDMIDNGAKTPATPSELTRFFSPSELPVRPGIYDCHRGYGFTVLCFFDGQQWKAGGWTVEEAYRNRHRNSGIKDWWWRGLSYDPGVPA